MLWRYDLILSPKAVYSDMPISHTSTIAGVNDYGNRLHFRHLCPKQLNPSHSCHNQTRRCTLLFRNKSDIEKVNTTLLILSIRYLFRLFFIYENISIYRSLPCTPTPCNSSRSEGVFCPEFIDIF